MLKLTRTLYIVLSATMLTSVSFNGLAIAKDQYINIGKDPEGYPVLLSKITQNGYVLLSHYGENGIKETRFSVECSQGDFHMTETYAPDGEGKVVETNTEVRNMLSAGSNSLALKSMRFFCRYHGVAGY